MTCNTQSKDQQITDVVQANIHSQHPHRVLYSLESVSKQEVRVIAQFPYEFRSYNDAMTV